MEDVKNFTTCTPQEYAKCWLELAKNAKSYVKTQDDATWLNGEIRHVKHLLNHCEGEDTFTLAAYIPSITEKLIAAILRRTNDKLRAADQRGYTNMVGADIIPIDPNSDDELSACEIKTVSFSQSRKDTANGYPYEASVGNIESKFTTLIVVMFDPNFSNNPYRLRIVGVDEYDTQELTCRFGEVVEIRGRNNHNASSINFPGTEIELSDLIVHNDKLYEFNMPKMNKVIRDKKVAKNQLNYWTEIFKMLIDRDAKKQLPKYFTRTPNTNPWNKNKKTVIATRRGFRINK